MRARQFRPSFDTLCQRITPSDVLPVGTGVDPAPVATGLVPCTGDGMPGSGTIINDLGNWQVGGTPQITPIDVLQPPVDPTHWVVVNN